ncbi:MAG TPA: family 10 glycosylhydrolase, partial [Methylomirabilota bacterium]|nr:family 10 glycosylhydrolase [Methylomirabilota bacterium]
MPTAAGQEFRALWVDAFHAGFRTPAEVTQLLADARAGHFNAVIVEVRKRGDAYYDSRFEPRATDISPAGYDPLADLIARAHDPAQGPRLEVHAWIVTYPIWASQSTTPPQANHPYNLHPDWLTRNNAGATWNGGHFAFDPGHPGVQQHTFNVAMDLISRYDLDGLNFDYVRYSGREWGYNPVAVERFNRRFGRTGQPAIDDPLWLQF